MSKPEKHGAARLPNFFIVGAPKTGTTSLYEYLRQHPNVFMPEMKEPHFYAEDLPLFRHVSDRSGYLGLFAEARPDQEALGEASVFYMYSSVAIPEIMRSFPSSRIIVQLRNPIDLIHSLHSELLFAFLEDQKDFAVAWELQEARARGERLPKNCSDGRHLQYLSIGRLGEQVSRLLRVVPREQVHFVVFDDLMRSPRTEYRNVLHFLGVQDDDRRNFPVHKPNRTRPVEGLVAWIMYPPFPFNLAKRGLKAILRGRERRIGRLLYRGVPQARAALQPEFRARLHAAFRDDIQLLGNLVGLDLGHWK